MQALTELQNLLRSTPQPQPPANYMASERICANSDKFFDQVERIASHVLEDTFFDSHWKWHGRVWPDGQMFIDCQGMRIPVHRFIYLLEVGPLAHGFFARPICGEVWCVNPPHLRPRRRQGGTRKLSDKARRDIHWLYTYAESRCTARQLSELFGVTERHVYRVIHSFEK